MPYSKLLKKIIAESGLTSKEVINKCHESGRKIDKAYLSKLLNNKVPAPSEDLSRMIANICNADERRLVLEGYIDKAPNEIKEIFVSLKLMITAAALAAYDNVVPEETIKEIKETFEKEPLSDFIFSLIDNQNVSIDSEKDLFNIKSENEKITAILKNPLAFIISDNAMSPIIPENSEVILKIQDTYENGDILLLKLKDDDKLIARYTLFDSDKVVLTSLDNKNYPKIICNKKDIIIFGKITKTINTIQI